MQKTPAPSFTVPADLMQGVLATLGSLPWNQCNGVMAPLVTLCQKQQAELDAAQAQGGTPAV